MGLQYSNAARERQGWHVLGLTLRRRAAFHNSYLPIT